jgi:hypothetical protein
MNSKLSNDNSMYSTEGAYQEDLEDAARWLSIASALESNVEETNEIQPANVTSIGNSNYTDENISVDYEPSSISSLSVSSTSGDDETNSVTSSDNDIESRISFLQKKQALLERAMKALQEEELYTASIAHSIIDKSHPSTTISSLCEEAKTILKALNKEEKKEGDESSTLSTKQAQKRKESEDSDSSDQEGSSKRFKIDITTVSRKVSTDLFQDMVPAPVSEDEKEDEDEPYPLKGSEWMAKSFLRYHKPSFEASQYSDWKIKRDPYVGNVAVPPSPTPFDRETELKDALSFTSTPQLITSSVPPFNVVHANAAFAILSGMNNIVGSSVESIFQVDNENVESTSNNTHQIFPDQILLNGKACQIVLTPIVDRVQNPKGGVSHLLLQVQQGDAAIEMENISSAITSTQQGTGNNNNRVFLTTIG